MIIELQCRILLENDYCGVKTRILKGRKDCDLLRRVAARLPVLRSFCETGKRAPESTALMCFSEIAHIIRQIACGIERQRSGLGEDREIAPLLRFLVIRL